MLLQKLLQAALTDSDPTLNRCIKFHGRVPFQLPAELASRSCYATLAFQASFFQLDSNQKQNDLVAG